MEEKIADVAAIRGALDEGAMPCVAAEVLTELVVLYKCNLRLWNLEDQARSRRKRRYIAETKRQIDVVNGHRHRAIDAVAPSQKP